ncbi:pyruvate carboxylase subunit B [Anaerobium acetethylicum]|uniref:Pyruvate carboxylase subunit B n=1 Tax=Anaerobium acetethylicum TaxID=1619234 RepID=A0A1D3TVG1_9FIRM|nr:pyruvate carboxylase subunit B [Anaerobium acetethylicum]SCP98141.1 pyruvate carboxylase subunit B [Anaerobium acetethylicum]
MFWTKRTKYPDGIGAADFINAGTPLKFNSVEFRDGQQSLLATRMTTADMAPLLTRMDQVGYDSIEMWGGATFDVAVRFLKEDPWDRIREFKKYVKKTPLKMVLRAQNLVGYKAYPDDIVEKFVEKAAEAGIDIFLIFDALQDLRNCESAFKAVKKAGKKIEGSVQYNISPFHTTDIFVQNALEQEKLGASLMHVEDMAGLMTPQAAYELISALKAKLKIPVHLHCHCTGGMAEMAYWEAIRAGVDGIDVCVSSMSMGPAHPPIESFLSALKGTSRDPGIELGHFKSINDDFLILRKKYAEYETKLIGVDVDCLEHQVPGGMLSSLESQLTAMNLYDRLPEILKEVTQVRADMGYPPLATPSSQICGAQATTNVITGKRYSLMSKELRDYCRGMYGMPPGPISSELLEKALGSDKPNMNKPADMLEPGFETAKNELGALAKSDEDILTYAMFPSYALDFLRTKYQTN